MNSASVRGQMNPNHAHIHYSTLCTIWEGDLTMNNKELYDFLEMLDRLTLDQKKDFLAFLRALQAQEQQHSASADTDSATS